MTTWTYTEWRPAELAEYVEFLGLPGADRASTQRVIPNGKVEHRTVGGRGIEIYDAEISPRLFDGLLLAPEAELPTTGPDKRREREFVDSASSPPQARSHCLC